MSDGKPENGPLSSEELERDLRGSGQTTRAPEEDSGHTLPASEAALTPDEDRGGGEPISHPGVIPPAD